jgi:hypothetical protein
MILVQSHKDALNGIITVNFGKHMTTEIKLQIQNITSKAVLQYGSENWIIREMSKNWKLHKRDS